MTTTAFAVDDGFIVRHRTRTVEIEDAERILCSRRRRNYATALREDCHAVLAWDTVRCPFCGKERSAVTLGRGRVRPDACEPAEEIDRETVRTWASPQMTLFHEALALNHETIPETYLCRYCGMESQRRKGSRQLRIDSDGKKLSVSCTGAEDLGVLLPLVLKSKKRVPTGTISLCDRAECVEETLVFNWKRRRAYLEASVSNETVLAFDLTFSSDDVFSETLLYRLLHTHAARRKLAHCFRDRLGALPFGEEELTPEAFVRLTRFGPLPRRFFQDIPIDEETGALDRSFRAAERFLTSANLPELLRGAALPQIKSVRRAFFEDPALFFYLREAEKMARLLPDRNLFLRFLHGSACYPALSLLHTFPATEDFFRDFSRVRTQAGLLHMLEKERGRFGEYAVFYSALAPAARSRERKRWEEQLPEVHDFEFHVPQRNRDGSTWDACVRGYSFVTLSGQKEFDRVAGDLNNCLSTWREEHATPVVGVRHGGRYCAAIEVGTLQGKPCVFQARTAGNRPIREGGADLFTAYRKWRRKYGLVSLAAGDVPPYPENAADPIVIPDEELDELGF